MQTHPIERSSLVFSLKLQSNTTNATWSEWQQTRDITWSALYVAGRLKSAVANDLVRSECNRVSDWSLDRHFHAILLFILCYFYSDGWFYIGIPSHVLVNVHAQKLSSYKNSSCLMGTSLSNSLEDCTGGVNDNDRLLTPWKSCETWIFHDLSWTTVSVGRAFCNPIVVHWGYCNLNHNLQTSKAPLKRVESQAKGTSLFMSI